MIAKETFHSPSQGVSKHERITATRIRQLESSVQMLKESQFNHDK